MKEYIQDQVSKYKESIRRCNAVELKSHEYYRTQGFLAAYEDVMRFIKEQEKPKPTMLEGLKHYLATHTPEQIKTDWSKYDTPENNVGPTVDEFLNIQYAMREETTKEEGS
jgi:hypothetical protein